MIVVTGATGFIGQHVVDRLVAACRSSELVCLAHDESSRPQAIGTRRRLEAAGVTFVDGDLVSGRGLDALPRSPSAVVHLASAADTGAPDLRVDDVGLDRLLEALSPLGADTRFVFTSSVAVSDHRPDPRRPATERTPLLPPFTEYGRKKLAAERLLEERATAAGFSLSILRLGVVVGPGARPGGLVDQLVDHAREGRWRARLDYPGRLATTSVHDVASIVASEALLPAATGAPIRRHFLGGETHSLGELLAMVHEELGTGARLRSLPPVVWRTLRALGRAGLALEPVLPRRVYNTVWQLGLLVSDGLLAVPEPPGAAPDHCYQPIREALAEVIAAGEVAAPTGG